MTESADQRRSAVSMRSGTGQLGIESARSGHGFGRSCPRLRIGSAASSRRCASSRSAVVMEGGKTTQRSRPC